VEDRPRTWVFLDEAAKAGELKTLDDVMLQGGSKGISVFLAYQDVLSVREAYGEKKADALLAQCSNTAVYHISGDATSQWASKLFGQFEAKEWFEGESTTISYHNR
jgi:type IV secretory pathway TraG/TraD family ATPase VirD4